MAAKTPHPDHDLVLHQKSEHAHALQAKMDNCPYYGTPHLLCQVSIQKPSWGGTSSPANSVFLSLAANTKYMKFVEEKNVPPGMDFDYFNGLFQEFLSSPRIPEEANKIDALKQLVAIRLQYEQQVMKFAGYIRTSAVQLEKAYPLAGLKRSKRALDYFSTNEKLVKGSNWQNLFAASLVDFEWVQELIEKEMTDLLKDMPIYRDYAQKIPGFGPWLTAYFVATIGNPLRFPSARHLRGYFGLRNPDGIAQRRKRGQKTDFNEHGKMMLLGRLTSSLMKQMGRFPGSHYCELLRTITEEQKYKAQNADLDILAERYNCDVASIENLGCQDVEDKSNPGQTVQKFLGYRLNFTNERKPRYILDPKHVWARINRKFAAEVLNDFYYAWKYTMGEYDEALNEPRLKQILLG